MINSAFIESNRLRKELINGRYLPSRGNLSTWWSTATTLVFSGVSVAAVRAAIAINHFQSLHQTSKRFVPADSFSSNLSFSFVVHRSKRDGLMSTSTASSSDSSTMAFILFFTITQIIPIPNSPSNTQFFKLYDIQILVCWKSTRSI